MITTLTNAIKNTATLILLYALPTIATAQFSVDKLGLLTGKEGEGKSFATVVYGAGNFFNAVYGIVFSLVVLFFLFSLARLLLGVEDPEKRKTVKFMVTWGVIALFVLISFAGIVALTRETINL